VANLLNTSARRPLGLLFFSGLALAAVEEAMIHAENKQEVAGFSVLYCRGITTAWQLLSFIRGTEAASVEVSR